MSDVVADLPSSPEPSLWVRRCLAFSIAIGAHALLAYSLTGTPLPPPPPKPPKPMEISLALALPVAPEPEPEVAPPPPAEPPPPAPQPEPVAEPVVELPPPVIKKRVPPRNPKPIKKPKPPKPLKPAEPRPETPPADPVPDAPPAPPAPKTPPTKAAPTAERSAAPQRREVDINTAYKSNPAPVYPPMSRRLSEEGTVYLRVAVSASGQVDHLDVKTSSGKPRLDEAALKAVKRWKFQPATDHGQPVASVVVVPITFNLN